MVDRDGPQFPLDRLGGFSRDHAVDGLRSRQRRLDIEPSGNRPVRRERRHEPLLAEHTEQREFYPFRITHDWGALSKILRPAHKPRA